MRRKHDKQIQRLDRESNITKARTKGETKWFVIREPDAVGDDIDELYGLLKREGGLVVRFGVVTHEPL